MNPQKKITTKQFPTMLKEDSSITDTTGIPHWENHENLSFKSSAEMLEWVSNDKINFSLSNRVYEAMVHCLENDVEGVIVATINVLDESSIDVVIRKPNFQKILSSFVKRLLEAEMYERLAEIKKTVEKYNLEIPN